MTLTQSRLREVLKYNRKTGEFVWKIATNVRLNKKVGFVAGAMRPDGYLYVGVDGKHYLAHRLVWLYVYGKWPENEIDHKNGIRNDNRICNLRPATRSQNAQNLRVSNSNSGNLGVNWCKRECKWRAYIKINRKMKSLGYYALIEDAKSARSLAERNMFPFKHTVSV